MGLQAMESFLQKSGMPTGDHSKLQKPKSQTQGASPDGGSLEGVGKTSGSNNGAPGPGQDADGQLKTSKSKKQKLSEDDADDEKQMKPHKKPIETVRKSLHPASQREMVAHENAVKVSQLRKGQPDVRVLSADDQAANLVSGDGFYYGDSPTLELRKSAPIHTGQQCPSCEETFSKSLSACPGCGHGTVGHRPTPSQFIGDAGDRPLLRKSMEPQDVMVGGPVEPVRLVSSGGVLRRR